jgi:hypothetical protein
MFLSGSRHCAVCYLVCDLEAAPGVTELLLLLPPLDLDCKICSRAAACSNFVLVSVSSARTCFMKARYPKEKGHAKANFRGKLPAREKRSVVCLSRLCTLAIMLF